jgi:hypothetical protein
MCLLPINYHLKEIYSRSIIHQQDTHPYSEDIMIILYSLNNHSLHLKHRSHLEIIEILQKIISLIYRKFHYLVNNIDFNQSIHLDLQYYL